MLSNVFFFHSLYFQRCLYTPQGAFRSFQAVSFKLSKMFLFFILPKCFLILSRAFLYCQKRFYIYIFPRFFFSILVMVFPFILSKMFYTLTSWITFISTSLYQEKQLRRWGHFFFNHSITSLFPFPLQFLNVFTCLKYPYPSPRSHLIYFWHMTNKIIEAPEKALAIRKKKRKPRPMRKYLHL